MTAGHEAEPYYVKTWKLRSPISFDAVDLPLALVNSSLPNRADQYVGEDTQLTPIIINFFSRPVYRARNGGVDEVNAANAECEAMVDRATDLIRADPTIGARFYDCQVTGATARQPGWFGNSQYPGAEMQCQAKRRRPWRI